MNVAAILTPDPVSVPVQASVDAAMELMEQRDIRHLPVLDGTRVVGVISDRDLLRATGWLHPAQRRMLEAPEGQVGRFMHSPAVTVRPEQDVTDVLAPMLAQRLGCLPVLREGLLIGMVSELDLLRQYVEACASGRIPARTDPPVERFMTRAVRTIAPDASGDEAAALLRAADVRHLPVVEPGDERASGAADGPEGAPGVLVGIVSQRDVFREAGRGRLELTLVSELMTCDPLTARPDERLSSVARILSAAKVSALPVVEDSRLVGIVSLRDVLEPCGRALQRLA